MKAAVLYGKKDLQYSDIEKPRISGEDEILIRVRSSGICGSDIPRMLKGTAHFFPIILGHEFSGTVEQVGPGVRRLKEGDRVACIPLVPDMKDPNSQRGNYSLGRNYSFIGSRVHGGWAEYVVINESNAFLLPDGVSYDEGAFFEPLTVALHAIHIMRMEVAQYVAITGMGTIGLLALQCVKAMGARRICVFDIDEKKLELARNLGADLAVNTGAPDFLQNAVSLTNGNGFDVALEAGGVPFTEILCLKLVAAKGRVMFIGTPHVPVTMSPEEFEIINRKELLVSGSWMNYSAPFPGWEWDMAADLFLRRAIQIDPLIDRRIPLNEAPAAMRDLETPGKVSGKILFRME
jgi:threonine dehydrogenase-like Zn-dependent dehydrogenase